MVINKHRVAQFFSEALESYEKNTITQQEIGQHLLQILLNQLSRFQNLLEIGCGTGIFSRLLMQNIHPKNWDLNDLCDVSEQLKKNLPHQNYAFYQVDGEDLAFTDKKYDLIVSCSTVQWFENQRQFIQSCLDHFNPNGVLLFSTFPPENLTEVRKLSGIGLEYPHLCQWYSWLLEAFHLTHLEQTQIQLKFDSPLLVLRHLKETGVTATNNQIWSRDKIVQFCDQYRRRYADYSGKVSLTYTPIFVLVRKK
ncbi:malonyl-ACP O-methyltransferase BioC [Aggregatibacter actinomycetemcomitans]|uniref:malonyl-ACP O-methyltransferase BioC n=1 Tax=Aggregatibacter actinomycetemcomitans TaxID=714 RepID=UPI000518FB57|nr:malonyl-ACP O-methyltransferase BioC [Aggregatibacter actinomycetemcomitans]KNE77958.1 biotin biosynthesis protein BioC [Aggregatibacter actinomycetemcomitans RhAA1]